MLETVDLKQKLNRDDYREQLLYRQLQLRQLAYQLYLNKRTLVVVYEGWDAAGKNSNVKRMTAKLDPRGYEVYHIEEPNAEDKNHHYLWQFWRRLKPPKEKQILIFNKSWYRRILTERVKADLLKPTWPRAYQEINAFEHQLVDADIIVAKFWLHISSEEQKARFELRKTEAHKAWKLTKEAWQQQENWDLYEKAVEDMLLRTNTITAPWSIIASEDKYHARVKVIECLIELLSKTLNYQPRDILQQEEPGFPENPPARSQK